MGYAKPYAPVPVTKRKELSEGPSTLTDRETIKLDTLVSSVKGRDLKPTDSSSSVKEKEFPEILSPALEGKEILKLCKSYCQVLEGS